uniref:PTS sugar transporter subunit IIA n=1 Tax=Gracilibacillus dipsosauri TaxID=178340 RepID=UPI002409D90C
MANKENKMLIYAPMSGDVVPLDKVPDPTFAQKMMGDGIAIDSKDGKVVSPVAGEVVQLFPTKHAIGLVSDSGIELLIHIGIDTVKLDGEGFEAHVKQGDKVEVGDPLITFDVDLIKEKAESHLTPIIVTNGDQFETLEKTKEKEVIALDSVLFTTKAKAETTGTEPVEEKNKPSMKSPSSGMQYS